MQKLFLFVVISFLSFSCLKKKYTVDAYIYYTPSCSAINGYIIIPSSTDSIRVYKHKIDSEFHQPRLPVKVVYIKDNNQNNVQEAGCAIGEVIKIKEIEKR